LLNPDGSHGPLKCAACHEVNGDGVPSRHAAFINRDGPYWTDFDKAVELQHSLR